MAKRMDEVWRVWWERLPAAALRNRNWTKERAARAQERRKLIWVVPGGWSMVCSSSLDSLVCSFTVVSPETTGRL